MLMVDNTSIMAHHDAELEGGGDHLIVIDFGTSQSPKSTRQRDSRCSPTALRPPHDSTPRWSAEPYGSHNGWTALGCGLQHGLWRASARRPCLTAWRRPRTTGLGGFAPMASSSWVHTEARHCIVLGLSDSCIVCFMVISSGRFRPCRLLLRRLQSPSWH